MEKKKITYHNFANEEYTSFKKGIDIQREIFKGAMHEKDYDSAATSLNNITIEIQNKIISRGNKNKIKRINLRLHTYRTLPLRYSRNTEYGSEVVYPPDIEVKIIRLLNKVYGIITEQLSSLGLI